MNYSLRDLIDIELFQILHARLTDIYSFSSVIVDKDGALLTLTNGQDICQKFHRMNPECATECTKSDAHIAAHLQETNSAVLYPCSHGLIDHATPIIVEGLFLGSLFTGHFFEEQPDPDYVNHQAHRYGFDKEAYRAAVANTPVQTRKDLERYSDLIINLIEAMARTALKNLRSIEMHEKHQEIEKKFQAMYEVASIGIAQADPNTARFIMANKKMCEITGYSETELQALTISDITYPDDRPLSRNLYQQVVHQIIPSYRLEKRYTRKDGSVIWVNVNMALIHDHAGRPDRSFATIEDITERKRSEELLRIQALMFDQIQDHITVTDLNGVITYVNKAQCTTLKRARNELIGRNIRILGEDPVHGSTQHEIIQHTLHDGEWQGEVVNYDANNERLIIFCRTHLIHDENGAPIAMCGIGSNITERKLAEETRLLLEQQLQQSQKMESIGRLAGGVAHDFNNMLGVILGHSEIVLGQMDKKASCYKDMEEIHHAASRSTELTRQLLAFARKQPIAPKRLDLNVTLAGMLKMLQRLIGEDIALNWRPGLEIWPIYIDPSQVDQIVANLCVNARDAIQDVGKVIIETKNRSFDEQYCLEHAGYQPGDYVEINIIDTGCGMDKETLSHLFEPFFTTKEIGKGTGLGLAMIYGIVQQNNGFIHVASKLDEGTTFSIYFPRHTGDAITIGTTNPSVEDTPLPPNRHETILLVEDEPAMLELATLMLEREGYNVLIAPSPNEAIHMAQEYTGTIHLLITDVIMPDMNGRDLVKTIQQIKPALQYLFMSGYTADIIASHGVLDEGMHFIQKPFTTQALATKIREVLRYD